VHWTRVVCRIVALLPFLALCACSSHKVLTPDDLRSDLFSANSYASELEMFIDYVRQGRATKIFAEAHARQLAKEIAHSEQELIAATPQPQDAKAFESCKGELEFIRRELLMVPSLIGNDDALRVERAKVGASNHQFSLAASAL